MNISSDLKLQKKYMIVYKTWLIAFVFTTVLNLIWYFTVASKFYKTELFGILRLYKGQPTPTLDFFIVAFAFFSGLLSFIVPYLATKPKQGIFAGCLLGFAIFAYHNFTNIAALRDWSIYIFFTDILWGTFQGGLLGYIAVIFHRRFSVKG